MKVWSGKKLEDLFAGWAEDTEEYRKVLVLFAYLLFVTSASTVGRTSADALFLSVFDASMLSKMYLPQAAALIVTGLIFQKFAHLVRLDRLISWLIPSITVLVILSRIGVWLGQYWVLPVIYVAYDVFNFLMVVCFWQFATSVLDQRKVKRTIGLVGSGGIVGGILSGFGLKALVPWIGTANLIYMYAALQILALVAVWALIRISGDPAVIFARSSKVSMSSSATKKRQVQREEGLFHSVPHLRYVAVMSAALILALTFIDYQFKVFLKEELTSDALAGFMGSFYGFAGLLALFIQVFVAGKLLTRFGVMIAILVFPVVLLMGSVGVLLMPILAMSVLVKGSDKVIGDTIHSSVNQLIMFPISPEWRGKAKSFLDGIVRNGAKGLAAVSLIVLAPLLSVSEFSFVVIGLLVVCIVAAIKVKGVYLKMLVTSLNKAEVKLDETEMNLMDPASLKLLESALHSLNAHQALYSFRILKEMDGFDLTLQLPQLLQHPSHDVVIEVLQYIEQMKFLSAESELLSLLERSNLDGYVKSYVILALCAYAKEEHLSQVTSYLEGSNMDLKFGAIAGLIKYYGIEGMFRAVGLLKQLLESKEEDERIAVAALFGRIGLKEFYKPLIPLLEDVSPQVRREALRSAGKLQATELIEYLIPMLQHGSTRMDALTALASYEEEKLIASLEPYFSMPTPPLHLPKVFERIASPLAYEKLLDIYPTSGHDMRDRLVEALGRIARHVKVSEEQMAHIEEIISQEVDGYWKLTDHLSGLSVKEHYEVVAETGDELRSSSVWRVFQLLALIYDYKTIQAVYANWKEGDVRQQANAMEVIDQLTHGMIRTELAKLMESTSSAMKAVRSQDQLIEQIMLLKQEDDEWLRKVIQHATNPDESDELKEHMERIGLLRKFPLFQNLSSRELSDLAKRLYAMKVSRGEFIFRVDQYEKTLYLIQSGTVGIYRDGEDLAHRGIGESFGQSGFLTHRERQADALAEEDCLLWALNSDGFYEAMFDRSSIAMEMMKILSGRLREVLAQQKTTSAPPQIDPHAKAKEEVAAALMTAQDEKSNTLLRRVMILQKIDLFAHLSETDMLMLAQMVDEVEYEAEETICLTGDYGDELFGIIEGKVRIHRGDVTFAHLGEGAYFGEMAIIDSGPRSADCTATEPTILLQLHKDQVFSLCFQNMEVLRSMVQVIGDRLLGLRG